MSDVGILTFVPAGRDRDQGFRNDVAEIEGRLRFIFTGWHLNPVFGGEPFHPGDRAITSLALGRLHLHHVVDAGACVLLLLLVGDVDARMAAEVARYADARIRPAVPLFLLGVEEVGGSLASALRVAGELRAMLRACDAAVAAIKEDDPGFHAFSKRIERSRDAVRSTRLDVRFQDDLRRHHHLSVCPGGSAPRSWQIPPLHALACAGITTGVVERDELERRTRWLIGAAAAPLDPRLVALRNRGATPTPGALSVHAAALAIRDLADERLATSVTLGGTLPAGASPEAVAAILNSLRDPSGRAATPLCVSTGDDEAAAITQHLLQRAALRAPEGQSFLDPGQVRPTAIAATFPIIAWGNGQARLAVSPGIVGSEVFAALVGTSVTVARVGFGVGAPLVAILEPFGNSEVRDTELLLPTPDLVDEPLDQWPADRMTLIPGKHADRLEALVRGIGFEVTKLGPPRRTSASAPRSSGS